MVGGARGRRPGLVPILIYFLVPLFGTVFTATRRRRAAAAPPFLSPVVSHLFRPWRREAPRSQNRADAAL